MPERPASTTAEASSESAIETFRQYVAQLLGQLQDVFPECEAMRKARDHFHTASAVDAFILAMARKHHDHLMAPLPPGVPYAPPVSRLRARVYDRAIETGQCLSDAYRGACYYDAYEYADSAVVLSSGCPFIESLGLGRKWEDECLDEESRHGIFDFLRAINDVVFEIVKLPPPTLFSVEEITDEIAEHRASEKVPMLQSGFTMCLLSLVDAAGESGAQVTPEAKESLRDLDPQVALDEWDRVASRSGGACESRLWEGLCAAVEGESEALRALGPMLRSLAVPSDAVWEKIEQLSLLARLYRKTPAHMFELIEQQAGTIAALMAQGKFDPSSQGMMQIGEEIALQCNAEDLQLLTQLINEELGSILAAFGGASASNLQRAGLDPGIVALLGSFVQ